jgi:hypothetical protein
MNLLYFGAFCDTILLNKVTNLVRNPFIVAQNKLEGELLKGLKQECIISKIYCMPTVPYNLLSKRFFIWSKITSSDYGKIITFPSIKIPFISYAIYFFYSFFSVLLWKPYNNKIPKSIFISVNFIPVSTAVLLAGKLRGIDVTVMLTDCARNTFSIKKAKLKSRIKERILNFYLYFATFIEKSFNSYVFITNKMNEIVNVRKKSFVIMEGIYKPQNNFSVIKKASTKKIILYAGSLFEIYGINKILEVSTHIKNENVEFHFYGDGECSELVKKASIKDNKIKFFGFVDQETLYNAMAQATLLINLRDPKLEYTTLSFPSKMFDYMASGTPLLTTKLSGIPLEYFNYIFYTDSYETQNISKQIESIINLDFNYLLAFGNKARKFITENKNYKTQSKKIINLLYNKDN